MRKRLLKMRRNKVKLNVKKSLWLPRRSNRLKESATLEIATEKEKAVAAVREEFVSLSILAASKVLGKEVSEEDNRALIEETIVKAGDGDESIGSR